jgi:histidinol dehydrogenase
MTKAELTAAVTAVKDETREALQELWDNINQGQRKQLAKRENIKALLDRYGVSY